MMKTLPFYCGEVVDFYIVLIMVPYFRLEIIEAMVNLMLGYSRETFDTVVIAV